MFRGENENIVIDAELSRIILRKALNIVLLKHQGEDEEKIAKSVNTDKKVVSKILVAFEQK